MTSETPGAARRLCGIRAGGCRAAVEGLPPWPEAGIAVAAVHPEEEAAGPVAAVAGAVAAGEDAGKDQDEVHKFETRNPKQIQITNLGE